MQLLQRAKENPLSSAIIVTSGIFASFVQPLWSLFTSKPLVPTVAGWMGIAVNDISLTWLPFLGVPIGLWLLYLIWNETRRPVLAALPSVSKSTASIRVEGSAKDSQIYRVGQIDLQLRIAVKFENGESGKIIIRRFNAYMINGISRQAIRFQDVYSTAPHTGDAKVKMDNGLPVEQGISLLYYIDFYVPELDEPKDEVFRIEVEILGKPTEVIEVIPHWHHIGRNELSNTVREIRNV